MTTRSRPLFTRETIVPALWASLRKLDPRVQVRNPVMFVVEIGSAITTGIFLATSSAGARRACGSPGSSRSGSG